MQGGDPTGTGRGGESIYGSVSMRNFQFFPLICVEFLKDLGFLEFFFFFFTN